MLFRSLSLLLLVALPLVAGCASYQLGAPGNLPFKKLYIEPVLNRSMAPQAQALVTENLHDAFARDGRIRVVASEAEADAVLTVTLTDYDKLTSTTRRDDTLRARSFFLNLAATATLTEVKGGEVYFQDVRKAVTQNAFVDNAAVDLAASAYQYMPILSRELAHQIADEVTSVW